MATRYHGETSPQADGLLALLAGPVDEVPRHPRVHHPYIAAIKLCTKVALSDEPVLVRFPGRARGWDGRNIRKRYAYDCG